MWEGKFYYIYRSGYWQELMEWETESLQEAFISKPEMAVYITGQSQMNWGNVGDWPPYWNVESQQWSFCGRTPHIHMHLAHPIDLWQIWPGPKLERGSWKDWQDAQEEATENASKWHCKWEQEGDASASSKIFDPGFSFAAAKRRKAEVGEARKAFTCTFDAQPNQDVQGIEKNKCGCCSSNKRPMLQSLKTPSLKR